MSLQQTEAHQESYFVAQLAAEAKRPDVAAPATIDSLVSRLSYLKDEEIDVIGELLSNLSGAIQVYDDMKKGTAKKEALNAFMKRVQGSIDS